VAKAREAISVLESSQCELVLQRLCFDVGKVNYLLRCKGDRVYESALHQFDAALRGGTEDARHGRISDESWIQATLGVDASGLGMKEASVIALPAFISSRVASRPLVEEMCRHTEAEGIAAVSQCMSAYDNRTRAACERWSTRLPVAVHAQARELIDAAAAAAVRRWRCWCEGSEEEHEDDQHMPTAHGSMRPGTAIVPDAGAEDPEHPASSRGSGGPKLQRDLVRISDACVTQGLLNRAVASNDYDRVKLLRELSCADCNHEWLWAISKHKGKSLSNEDFALAARIRLGSGGPGDDVICANCGEAALGPAGTHGLLCVQEAPAPEATMQ
jgi:hypothetical protein